MQNKESFTRWLPLVGLTFAVFVFNTSEFMPIGLLTDIATDLNISEARAGLLISVYAWVVAIMSLPLMIMVSKMELKRLLLSIIALFVVSHVGSALAEGYYTLMLSRIGVACAHSIFSWCFPNCRAAASSPSKSFRRCCTTACCWACSSCRCSSLQPTTLVIATSSHSWARWQPWRPTP